MSADQKIDERHWRVSCAVGRLPSVFWVGWGFVAAACGGNDAQGELSQQRDSVGPPPLTDTSRDAVADTALDIDTEGDTAPGPDTTGLEDGEPCQENAQCLSGHCALTSQGGQDGRCVSSCDPSAPVPETCNGRDDDCDGEVDGAGLCGDFACAGVDGCKTRCESNADCRLGLGCDRDDRDGDGVTDECLPNGDNGTLCAADEECSSGACSNGYCCPVGVGQASCCAQDADCAILDGAGSCLDTAGCVGQKVVGRCEGFVCVARQVSAPESCAGSVCRAGMCTGDAAGGSVFGGPHLCDNEGTCIPTPDRRCDDGNVCTIDTCGVSGCEAEAFTGTTSAACYTFAPATRGVGLCADGAVKCEGGSVIGCIGERGPSAEVCNGKDDDCDGLTDEDTEPSCFPYLCAGTAGCGVSCGGNQDCAAGNFCQAGRCVGTGQTGASCASGEQCASGHCSQGVCCASGLCCVSSGQCGSLAQSVCESTEPSGCVGFALSGVCTAENRCETVANVDVRVCTGRTCKDGRCEGASVVPSSACSATGQCVDGVPVSCAPYVCKDGACKSTCAGDADCSAGSCVNGQCSGLPPGSVCTNNGQCAGGRCNNGFCCANGTCCGDDRACSGLTQAPTCSSADTCGGTQVVGVCGAGFSCRAETRSVPEACLGASCGAPRCVNLSGSGVVLEGVERKTCNATGTCVTGVKDCRDFDDTAYCTNNSTVYPACRNCSPRRSTCVVFDNPCFCE